MNSLPDFCTIDEAIAICERWHAEEEARLLAEYRPYEPAPEDRGWLAPLELADEGEMTAWCRWAERVADMHEPTGEDLLL